MSAEQRKLMYVWGAMKSRCFDVSNPAYSNYGGRGITVCERWMKFSNFLADMAPRPQGLLLDRVDNDKNYEPGNCQWATRKEQNSNRRSCIYVSIQGSTVTLKEACRIAGLKYRPVHKRIAIRGWDIARALSTPIGKGNSHATHTV